MAANACENIEGGGSVMHDGASIAMASDISIVPAGTHPKLSKPVLSWSKRRKRVKSLIVATLQY